MQKKLDTFALKFKTFGMQVVENLVVEKIQNLFDDSSVREDNIKMSFFFNKHDPVHKSYSTPTHCDIVFGKHLFF
jgi:hypothetical protein